MKHWPAFYPLIIPDVPGCPDPMVNLALVSAAREFCQRSGAWLEWADTFDATGGTQRFDFDLPSQTELVAAKRATVDGNDVSVLGRASLPPGWDQTGFTFDKRALIHIDFTEFVLYPVPSSGTKVSILMALKPDQTALGVSDAVFTGHSEVIAKGALKRLLSQPNKPYTDLNSAAIANSQFETGVHLAANAVFRQASVVERRVKKWG